MEFTEIEKQAIQEAIGLRKRYSDFNQKYSDQLSSILVVIGSPFLKLSRKQKALLRGCIKESIIDPNESYLAYTDYDVFLSGTQLKPVFDCIDAGLSILAKLKDEDYGSFRLFGSVGEKVKQFKSIDTVYYSLSGNKLYKAGVVLSGGNGFKIESDDPDFSRFEMVKLSKEQFMHIGTPAEVVAKIKNYQGQRVIENHNRLLSILTPALSN